MFHGFICVFSVALAGIPIMGTGQMARKGGLLKENWHGCTGLAEGILVAQERLNCRSIIEL